MLADAVMAEPIMADPIVAAKIEEFCSTVQALVEAKFMQDDDRIKVVRELCELSRSAKFDLGSLRFASAIQAKEVAKCFEDSVPAIRGMWPAGVPKEVEKYCTNILRRAKKCRGEE